MQSQCGGYILFYCYHRLRSYAVSLRHNNNNNNANERVHTRSIRMLTGDTQGNRRFLDYFPAWQFNYCFISGLVLRMKWQFRLKISVKQLR